MRIADPTDMDSDRVGGYQFVLTELYRTEQGLRHHWTFCAEMFSFC